MSRDFGRLTGSREPNPQAVSALTGFDPERVADLTLALDYALAILVKFEPPDSRAMSDEFVAMASISCGHANEECRNILTKAMAREEAAAMAEYDQGANP